MKQEQKLRIKKFNKQKVMREGGWLCGDKKNKLVTTKTQGYC